jgi:hypothetical protein
MKNQKISINVRTAWIADFSVNIRSIENCIYHDDRQYVKKARKFKRKVRQIAKIGYVKTKIDNYV